MNFKAWFKSNTADRVLLPLRMELVELIEPRCTLLEVGCGTGDLLFQAAGKIKSGHGIDIDRGMITHAESNRQKQKLDKLSFECIDALSMTPRKFDISTSTLCLHELPRQKACALLKMMVDNSDRVLVADFTRAKSASGRLGIEFDELISGHYRNYRQYRRGGEIPSCAREIGATVHREIASVVDGISIWQISKIKEG